MRSKAQNQRKFMRIITTPIRILGKARDFYVRSMNNYADRATHASSLVTPSQRFSGLAKSYSFNPPRSFQTEDYSELLRAASVRSMGHKNEIDMILQEKLKEHGIVMRPKELGKSKSIGLGRIDEEGSVSDSFREGGADVVKQEKVYPRSRSHSVSKGTLVL